MGNQEWALPRHLYTRLSRALASANRVDVIMGRHRRTPSGLTGGSRALAVAGGTAPLRGGPRIDNGTQLAAHLLEVSRRSTFCDGVFACPAPTSASMFSALAKRPRIPRNCRQAWIPGLITHQPRTASSDLPQTLHVRRCRESISNTPAASYRLYKNRRRRFRRTSTTASSQGPVHGGIVQGIGQALLYTRSMIHSGATPFIRLVHGLYAMPRPPGDVPPCFLDPDGFDCANPRVSRAGEAGGRRAPQLSSKPPPPLVFVRRSPPSVLIAPLDMPATPRRVWEMLNETLRPTQSIHHLHRNPECRGSSIG